MSVLTPLGLTATSPAVDEGIQNKTFGSASYESKTYGSSTIL